MMPFLMVSDGFPPHNNDGTKSLKNKQKSWNKKERERERNMKTNYILNNKWLIQTGHCDDIFVIMHAKKIQFHFWKNIIKIRLHPKSHWSTARSDICVEGNTIYGYVSNLQEHNLFICAAPQHPSQLEKESFNSDSVNTILWHMDGNVYESFPQNRFDCLRLI